MSSKKPCELQADATTLCTPVGTITAQQCAIHATKSAMARQCAVNIEVITSHIPSEKPDVARYLILGISRMCAAAKSTTGRLNLWQEMWLGGRVGRWSNGRQWVPRPRATSGVRRVIDCRVAENLIKPSCALACIPTNILWTLSRGTPQYPQSNHARGIPTPTPSNRLHAILPAPLGKGLHTRAPQEEHK
jgi:hypothetical protein